MRCPVPRRPVPHPAPLALAALLAVVSWHSAWNLGGLAGAVGYATAIIAAAAVVLPWAGERLRRAPAAALPTLVVVVALALVVAFVVGVPAALGDALGAGSDRANALDVALSRLADGRYPYAATTYVGNPITPLPGALLLAAPFWWLTGSAAWQNVAWVLVLLAVVGGGRRAWPAATCAFTVVGGLEVLREYLVGDDLVTGTVPALAATVWILRVAARASVAALTASALVLGMVTCTRPHLALVVAVVAVAVGVLAGWRRAALVGVTAGLVWAALIVPFLLGGTARFSPLHVAAKVTGNRSVTVGIVVVALVAVALLAVALARLRPSTPGTVGWLAAAVLFAPSVLSLARSLVAGSSAGLDLTLGAAAVPFAVWATACRDGPPPEPAAEPALSAGTDRTR